MIAAGTLTSSDFAYGAAPYCPVTVCSARMGGMAYTQNRLITREEASARLSVSTQMVATMQRIGSYPRSRSAARRAVLSRR